MQYNKEELESKALECLEFWKTDHLDMESEAWRAALLEMAVNKLGLDVQELLMNNPMPVEFGFIGGEGNDNLNA